MSITHTRYGGRLVLRKKTRLTNEELQMERDRMMFEASCDGKSDEDIARIFRVTDRWVRFAFSRIPEKLKGRYRRDATVRMRARLKDLAEERENLQSA